MVPTVKFCWEWLKLIFAGKLSASPFSHEARKKQLIALNNELDYHFKHFSSILIGGDLNTCRKVDENIIRFDYCDVFKILHPKKSKKSN